MTGALNYAVYGQEHGRQVLSSIDFDRIRANNPVSAVVGKSIALQKAGREYSACCPFHPDKTPSFTVNDDKGFYHCFGCGAHGDVLDFVVALHGVELREAAAMLDGGDMPAVIVRPAPVAGPDNAERTAEAMAIWNAASAIGGTPAEMYLRRRAISIPLPDCFRFARLRFKGERRPCLVALVSAPNGDPQAIHRIFLDEAGGKASMPDGKVKFSLGPLTGGAIRLSPVFVEMGVCASVEDGLSLIQLTGLAVWAVTGDTSLHRIVLPDVVRSVVVGHDADASGRAAGQRTAETFAAQRLKVRLLAPLDGCKDFNDELKGGRA